jgi:hypothetical protein
MFGGKVPVTGPVKNGHILSQRWTEEGQQVTLKKLIRDGRVDLVPDEAHAGLTGQLEFVDLGEHLLGLAGLRRKSPEVLRSVGHGSTSQVLLVAGA